MSKQLILKIELADPALITEREIANAMVDIDQTARQFKENIERALRFDYPDARVVNLDFDFVDTELATKPLTRCESCKKKSSCRGNTDDCSYFIHDLKYQ